MGANPWDQHDQKIEQMILQNINKFQRKRDLIEYLGLSQPTFYKYLHKLEKKGLLKDYKIHNSSEEMHLYHEDYNNRVKQCIYENIDKFPSRAAFMRATGIPKSIFYRKLNELVREGYLDENYKRLR